MLNFHGFSTGGRFGVADSARPGIFERSMASRGLLKPTFCKFPGRGGSLPIIFRLDLVFLDGGTRVASLDILSNVEGLVVERRVSRDLLVQIVVVVI